MLVADVTGEDGVEGCYNRSLISAEVIRAIRDGTFDALQSVMQRQGQKVTGMLHEFRRAPVRVDGPRATELSVCEQMLRDVQQGIELRTGMRGMPSATEAVYRGAVLVPKPDKKELLPQVEWKQRKVLAWATWTESMIPQAELRTYQSDRSVRQVRDVLRGISFDQGIPSKALKQSSGKILLLDTLNAHPEALGAASVLFAQLCPEWERRGYEWILLYRHKILEVMRKKSGELHLPQWHNEASRQFFHQRGLRDVGTRLSPVLAERDILFETGDEKETVRVRSTEGWMLGQLSTVQRASTAIDAHYREQFSL